MESLLSPRFPDSSIKLCIYVYRTKCLTGAIGPAVKLRQVPPGFAP